MEKDKKREQKRAEKEKRKAEFDELNHQRALKYKKLQDTKKAEKQNYKKKAKKLKLEYKDNLRKIKSDNSRELKTILANIKTLNGSGFENEADKIKKENIANLKKKLSDLEMEYKENLFSIKMYMLYEIAKNQVTEKQQKKGKMNADKKLAYHIYHKKMKVIDNIYNQKVNEISKGHQDQIDAYNKKKAEFTSQNKKNKKSIEYKQKLDEFRTQYIKINLDRESKLIENKIIYKNTCAQALHERDLSYDNELDTGFKFRRWWYGIGKEFQRMSWSTYKRTFKDFWIVIFVSLILASIFMLLDYILTLF